MKKVGFGILGALGIVFIITGSVIVGIFPKIMKDKVAEELPIVNGTESWNRWIKNPVPITMKFHFFSLNNTDYKSLDYIKLEERGPFVYSETRVKENIHQISDEFISYQEKRSYTHEPEKGINETELISFINFPLLGVLQNKIAHALSSATMDAYLKAYPASSTPSPDSGLFVKDKMANILFDGVPYKIFKELGTLALFLAQLDIAITPEYKIETRSRVEEEWTVNTGKKDIDKIGQLFKFDSLDYIGNKHLKKPIWKFHEPQGYNCSKLEGTDGTFFKPSISKDDVLYAFEPQLCRTVYFKFWKETVVRGISTYRFRIPVEYFQSAVIRKQNECYCVENNITDCNTSGVLEISNCGRRSLGAPIVMSAPYFIHGDASLRNQFKNGSELQPMMELNDDNYGTYVDIEPITGVVLKAVRRLQMNIKITKADYHTMKQLSESSKTEYVVPVFWIEETGEADEKQADDFKSMVTNKKKLANGLSITVIVIGGVMVIVSVFLFMRNR